MGFCFRKVFSLLLFALFSLSFVPVFAAVTPSGTNIRNTATIGYKIGGAGRTGLPSTTAFVVSKSPTQATTTLYQYTTSSTATTTLNFDGGYYQNAASTTTPLEVNLLQPDGTPLPNGPILVLPTTVYHTGEPVLIKITDDNRNENPNIVECIRATIVVPLLGDAEEITLCETGFDTGEFTAKIQGVPVDAPKPKPGVTLNAVALGVPKELVIKNNGRLSMTTNSSLVLDYQDPDYPNDKTPKHKVLVDPIDPAILVLTKNVSVTEASVGDFLQYRLTLTNASLASPAIEAVITDTMPFGMRYRGGSLHIAGKLAPNPRISNDGATLTIPVGRISVQDSVMITYVVELGAGVVPGDAVNQAKATASGDLISNVAQATVKIREPFMGNHFTIIGRVLDGDCGQSWETLKGLPNIRILMEDGTNILTDRDGLYHFKGVVAGSHVVQIDLDSLPEEYEVIPCIQNSRFAGRSFSQFVDAQGGALWRADFYVRAKPIKNVVGISLTSKRIPQEIPLLPIVLEETDSSFDFRVEIDGEPATVHNLQLLLSLPKDIIFTPNSTRVGDVTLPDPEEKGGVLILPLGDMEKNWKRIITFNAHVPGPSPCRTDPSHVYIAKAQAEFNIQSSSKTLKKTPVIESLLICPSAATPSERKTVTFFAQSTDYPVEVTPNAMGDDSTQSEIDIDIVEPARIIFVPELSKIKADGINSPVIAVRVFDKDNNLLPAGTVVSVAVDPPYTLVQEALWQRNRALAGTDRFVSYDKVQGNDGIAYIELSPTTTAGNAVIRFVAPDNTESAFVDSSTPHQEVRVWLTAVPRNLVVVGFAEGTLGYNTLHGKMENLSAQGVKDNFYVDGQVKLYAKGRVQGKWLLTLAYDSNKPVSQRRESLLSTIDPNQYYTLYGDGTEQKHDASSQYKVYLKLETDQFYALFGDYETGLTQTELSRYSRSLSGIKSEYNGGAVSGVVFAAQTAQRFAKDEIQGNGTSGLYRLRLPDIVLNSEKIRVETRDRFHSEKVVSMQNLSRHIDYEIDYAAGTLFFKMPIQSRDANFNPIFIVADYETFGIVDQKLNAGGHVSTSLLDGKLSAGLSYIHDESTLSKTELFGTDIKWKFGEASSLRLEGATSDGKLGAVDGSAYLAEITHTIGDIDLLASIRRQSVGFGMGQQGVAEQGTFKSAVDAKMPLSDTLSLGGQLSRQENLTRNATRDLANLTLHYKEEDGGARIGARLAEDRSATNLKLQSQQVMVGANRFFLENQVELDAQIDAGLGGRESVDFPTRYRVGVAYALTEETKFIVNHEYTDGNVFNTQMTRVGLQTAPWKGAILTSTLNQQGILEYGPRTFAVMGLMQSLILDEHWGADYAIDSSRTFNESSAPLIINPAHPLASGGMISDNSLTDDFTAASAGLTYRTNLWSANTRAELRKGQTTDRYGLTGNFLRQIKTGIAFSSGVRIFKTEQITGTEGLLVNANMGLAYRPLESSWSVLDKLELKIDQITNGSGLPVSGNNSPMVNGNAKSRRLLNHLNVNHVSKRWNAQNGGKNPMILNEQDQWSLYYGAKYVFDQFDGTDYKGYTDLLALERRYDLRYWTKWIDFGVQASVLHVWGLKNYAYSLGPMVGVSPIENAWIVLGYNVLGFTDRDFSDARYTAQGPYIKLRFKFDQQTQGAGR